MHEVIQSKVACFVWRSDGIYMIIYVMHDKHFLSFSRRCGARKYVSVLYDARLRASDTRRAEGAISYKLRCLLI